MRQFFLSILMLSVFCTISVAQHDPLPDFLDLFKKHQENKPVEKVFLHLDKSEYAQAETIWIKSYVVAGPGHQLSPMSKTLYVELLTEKGELVERLNLKSEEGLSKASLIIPRNQPQGFYYLRAYTNWMRNEDQAFFYTKKIRILSTREQEEAPREVITQKVDLQFYPEGGELIDGLPSKLAFEVTGLDLTEKNIEGQILDSDGKVVKEFSTQHEGRGMIPFVPTQERYTAKLEGIDQSFDVPTVRPFGQVMSVNSLNPDYLSINIKSTTESKEPFYVVAHTRGYVTYASQTMLTGTRGFLKIDKSTFPSGISHVTLFNKYMEPIAERLVFIDKEEALKIQVNTNKQQYANRELATLGIKVTDAQGNPVQGSFSMSAFQSDLVKNDQPDHNIHTHLLMTSDLPGHIRKPQQYFENTKESAENLDLLMMVNGWRRFSWVDIRDQPQMLYPVETGLTLEGQVTRVNGSQVKDGKVFLVNANPDAPGNGSQFVNTDEDGRFSFNNLDYTDTTFLRFQGFQKEGKKNVMVAVDTSIKTPLPLRNPYALTSGLNDPLREHEYKKYAQTAIYIDSTFRQVNGITYLGTVTVEADRREARRQAIRSQIGPGESYVDFEDIPFKQKAGRNPYQMLLGRVGGFHMAPPSSPGINQGLNTTMQDPMLVNAIGPQAVLAMESMLNGSDPMFRPPALRQGPFTGGPLVLLDNVVVPWDVIYSVQATEIDFVEVYKTGTANMFGMNGFDGALAFYTLKGERYFKQFPKRGLLYTKIGGYHTPREFYAPRYDTRRRQRYIPDRRSTVFWEPMITTDENGEAMLNFFTPDDVGNVTIDVQGISANGQSGTGKADFTIRSNF